MANRIIAFLLFTIIVQGTFGQNQVKRDSLLNVLSKAKEDTNKINTLLLLGGVFERSSPDSAAYYYKQAGALSEKLKFDMGTLKYIARYTEVLNLQSKYDEALALNLQSIELSKRTKLPKRIAAAYSNTAVSYYYKADYITCTDYFIKAIQILEQQKLENESDKKDLGGLYANVTGIFSELKQDDKAYNYGTKGLVLAREINDKDLLVRCLNNIGNTLTNLKKYDSASLCLQQVISIATQTNNKASLEVALIQSAGLNEFLGNYTKMFEYAQKGLALAKELEDADGISKCDLYISQYYFNIKNFTEARSYAEQGLTIARQNGLNNHLGEEYLMLSDIELALGNYSEYHRLRNLSDSIKEVVLSEEILQNTQELEAKYSSNKKQMQIDSLAREKTIQGLEIKQKRQANIGLVAALVIFTIIGLLYYRNYQQKKKLLESAAVLQQQRIKELEKEKQLSATQAIVQGQEEERTRLAKDLHDGLGGILSSTKYSLSNMKQNLIITPENATAFERTMTMLDQSITELRRVAHNMMPETLMKLSLSEALQDYAAQVTQSGALTVNYQSYGTENLQLDNAVKITVYRVVQELINNTIKHAHASSADVQLIYNENKLNITVEDNGSGFDKTLLNEVSGIGYKNLQSRIDFLKGTLDVQSQAGKGTSVYIEIPLAQ